MSLGTRIISSAETFVNMPHALLWCPVSTGISSQSTGIISPKMLAGGLKPFSAGRHYARALCSYPARFGRKIMKFRITAAADSDSASIGTKEKSALLNGLKDAVEQKSSDGVKTCLDDLKSAGYAKLWMSYPNVTRRTTYMRELTQIGIKNAEALAVPSSRNDLAFLVTVVGTTSVLAVIAGQLPGDWGFFIPYLLGGISLAVLAIGSTAPGLLEVAIGFFSSAFADTKERVLRHEAAHFLLAYLVGLPVIGYSLNLGKEHVNLVDEKLQKRIYESRLEAGELDRLAAVSMAGLAAEGLQYDKVVGQSADLFSLQRLMNRSKPPLSNDQQQSLTRWAVVYAASLLKSNDKAYEALMVAMSAGASVGDCVAAIEATA